jgi:hypothetical protein
LSREWGSEEMGVVGDDEVWSDWDPKDRRNGFGCGLDIVDGVYT